MLHYTYIIQLSHLLSDLFLSEYNFTKYLTFTAGCSVVNWRERRPEIVVSSSGPGRPRPPVSWVQFEVLSTWQAGWFYCTALSYTRLDHLTTLARPIPSLIDLSKFQESTLALTRLICEDYVFDLFHISIPFLGKIISISYFIIGHVLTQFMISI